MLWQRLFYGSLMILVMAALVFLDFRLSSRRDSSAVSRALPAATPNGSSPAAASDPGDGLPPAHQSGPAPWSGLAVTILAVLLAAFGAMEAGALLRSAGFSPPTGWAAFISAGLCLIPWIEMLRRTCGLRSLLGLGDGGATLTLLWLAGGVIGCCLIVLARRTTDRAFANMACGVFLLGYLGLLTSFAVRIRCLDPGPAGAGLFVAFIVTVKVSDIGAYFTGLAMGRHKLAPVFSPGKTVEGFVGGCLASGMAAVAAWSILRLGTHPGGLAGQSAGPAELSVLAGTAAGVVGSGAGLTGCPLKQTPLWVLQAFVFGLLMAIAGQLGDLVESAWKRDLGTKDSAQVVPSFGGVLDIIDSPVLAAPVAWWWFTAVMRMG